MERERDRNGPLAQPLLSHPVASEDDEEAAVSSPKCVLANGTGNVEVEEVARSGGGSSVAVSAANATNALLGAGMYALPRAFAGLGLLAGTALTLGVALVMMAGIDVLLRAAERQGKRAWTLAGLLERAYGRRAALAVRAAIICMGFGFLAVYLVVICEMVLGTPEISGLIPDLFPQLVAQGVPWWLHRRAVLTWTTLAVAPLLLFTSLGDTILVSLASVACSVASCLVLVVLCITGSMQGVLPDTPWTPQPSVFGSGVVAISGMLSTTGQFMTAYIIQHAVSPLVMDLAHCTKPRAQRVFNYALSIGALVYLATGACGAAVFGRTVAGDVLASMDVQRVQELLWCSRPAALALVVGIKGAVVGALLTSFPITLWPMRAEIIDLLLRGLGGSQITPRTFYLLTYCLLAGILVESIAVRSMYQLAGLVGSVSGILLAFIFPGMLALKDPCRWRRALGAVLLPTGAFLMAAGLATLALGEA